jgi:uncharacterized protein YkwD
MKISTNTRVVILLSVINILFYLQAQTVGIKDSTPQATTNNFLTSDEIQLAEMLNKLRVEDKLPIFEIDSTLTILAREHSQEMVELKYFNTNSPKYGTPKKRATLQFFLSILDYPTFAFVAQGKSTADVISSLIKNKGAKKTLFSDSRATHVGIGTVKNSKNEIFATFHFSNRIVEVESTFGMIGSWSNQRVGGCGVYLRLKGKTKEKFMKFKVYKSPLLPEDYKSAVYFYEEIVADDSSKFDITLNFKKGGFTLFATDDAGIAIFTKPSKQSEYVLRAYMRIWKFKKE